MAWKMRRGDYAIRGERHRHRKYWYIHMLKSSAARETRPIEGRVRYGENVIWSRAAALAYERLWQKEISNQKSAHVILRIWKLEDGGRWKEMLLYELGILLERLISWRSGGLMSKRREVHYVDEKARKHYSTSEGRGQKCGVTAMADYARLMITYTRLKANRMSVWNENNRYYQKRVADTGALAQQHGLRAVHSFGSRQYLGDGTREVRVRNKGDRRPSDVAWYGRELRKSCEKKKCASKR